MKTVSCLLVDDDIDEHEIFMMAVENDFNCANCWCAASISQAIARSEAGKLPLPDFIFIDWSVISHDVEGSLDMLRLAFPGAAQRIHVISGIIPLVDTTRFGIAQIHKKQASIPSYGAMVRDLV